jgi:hypothetical protein
MGKMADETAAERAYQAALREIERVREGGGPAVYSHDGQAIGRQLNLWQQDFRALAAIPPEIANIAGLISLRLYGNSLSDLSPLCDLTGLQHLSLNQTAVSDLSPLSNLTALRSLSLNQTAVGDLSPLRNLTALEYLSLDQTAVSDLFPLRDLNALESLSLNQTAVSDLSPLRDLTALESLSLDQTAVSDLSPLRDLTALQGLSLDQTAVSDLSPLNNLTALVTLSLDQTAVSDLSPLRDLTALYSLSLNQTAVSDISALSGLTKLQSLQLNQTAVSDPSPLRDLTALAFISLNQTAVSDLSPLRDLTALQFLFLRRTAVGDLSPLRNLTELRSLWLDHTKVGDLRQIAHLNLLGSEAYTELSFHGTPAAAADPALARLAQSRYHRKRTRETLAYLQTLPPWPEPLPGEQPEEQPLTVTALIEAQDRAGWRYVPGVNALQLYVTDLPTDARQEQMARMVAERCERLINKLGTRVNSGGLRQEAHEETKRFQAILADESRSLGMRSLELWGSLIALGDLLEENDKATKAGRDSLDLLPAEARAALSTLLGVAAGLVRSFPEARALDDDHGSFLRRSLSREVVRELLEGALRAALIEPRSAALVQHVAAVGAKEGQQAEKADGVTMAGLRNLVLTAHLLSATVGGAVGGIVGGVTSDIGTDISNHYELGEKAVEFLAGSESEIERFLDALTNDERAVLKAALEDTKRRHHPQ